MSESTTSRGSDHHGLSDTLKKQQQALKRRLRQTLHIHGHPAEATTMDRHGDVSSTTNGSNPHIVDTTGVTFNNNYTEQPPAQIDCEQPSSLNSSMIFERSVMQPISRTQSFASARSIPHLTQEALVPSVLDAAAAQDDNADHFDLICGPSGHPLCKRRHSAVSMAGCPFHQSENTLTVVLSNETGEEREEGGEEEPEEKVNHGDVVHEQRTGEEAEQEVDYSDQTKLNFCSFADLVSDEENTVDHDLYHDPKPVPLTRRSSVVVIPATALKEHC
ncbi:uncharacterized protein CYBJADRAFT_50520 [Cyberlindnera jadinii NRRL Y-1542]|uniref:Uncharacterized protein n=1 Tax=Cyberlindnera jadinii (strain ATCC 18201 / CBS 1600 / BCRC 20928 / JCM 3617 / NBRC 0987 / NRRL Y-1542) TaxID=983966 RepID=A0A1E4S7Z9_CYBJN|nr:hypothetical protein CYBJADRAFT_50520 [Cyberlindnera jadinii NRRL Y-1542]ODV75610.1 hypothetical protein CYBJADRAFT_50520 [Cyberlindnera jadinii NRRL Y-1542]